MRVSGWRGWLALTVGVLFTLLAVGLAVYWSYAAEQRRQAIESDRAVQLLSGRIQQVAAASAALATLFRADPYVDADQFRLLGGDLLEHSPFLSAAFYASRVRPADRTDFEAGIQDGGAPGFRIHGIPEEGGAKAYYPLRYLEPFTPLTARRLGLDLEGLPQMAAALEQATATDSTILAVGTCPWGEATEYWLLHALYRSRGRPAVAERATLAGGVVGLALEPSALADGLHRPDERLRLTFQDGTGVEPLFDNRGGGDGRADARLFQVSQRYELPFAGGRLVVEFERGIGLGSLLTVYVVAALSLGVVATLLLLTLAAQFGARREAELALRHSYGELEQRVQERTAALEEAKARLEASNGELQQFAYVISHDLQEPLRMVSSYLALLRRRYRGQLDRDAEEFIGFAVDGAERMSAMIEGLLQYSRVETQGRAFQSMDLNAAVAEALDNLRLVVSESSAEVSCDPLPRVAADASQMQRLFQNLIGNALKFRGEAAPRVWITVDRQEAVWRISVRDNGIGIPPDQTERIFTVFQRLHTRQEYPGLGIGLAVCRRIVERHGGKIAAEASGQGAIFRFTLPVTGSEP